MKHIKRTFALLLAMAMVLTMLPLAAVAEDQAQTPAEPVYPDPGAINMKKEANATENEYEYEITLTIQGKNYYTTSDVVLVIDNSNSMYAKGDPVYENETFVRYDFIEDDSCRMHFTKQAATAFVERLLTENSATRIALVVYTRDADSTGTFYTAENKSDLIAAINDIRPNTEDGGTNTQAGIHKARELLKESKGVLKNIVLLSDGVPTYSYELTGTITWKNCSVGWLSGDHYWNIGDDKEPFSNLSGYLDESTITFTGCNYDTLCGAGYTASTNKYEPGKYVLTEVCEHGNTRSETYSGTQDHSVATIWEANQAKAESMTIFSVALQAGDEGEGILHSIASDPTEGRGYFTIDKDETDVGDKLTSAFTAIAGSIAIAASDGTVTDPMSDYVTFKPAGDKLNHTSDKQYENTYAANGYDVYISQGTVAWDETTKTFTWETGNINEGVDAIMKYRVKINDNVEVSDTAIPTNGETTFTYINYLQKRTTKDFNPIPKVTKDGGTIMMHFYRVDGKGNPVNENGVKVNTPLQAEELAKPHLYAVGEKTALVYDTYTVPAETIENAVYYGYTLDSEAADTQPGTPSITLSKQNSVAHVWFAYYEGFNIVHVQNGVKVSEETLPVTPNFDITAKVTEGYLYGGTFSDEACETIWDFGTENPTSFTPVAGETYYIWEVNQNYLMPKLYRAYAHPTEHNNATYVTQLHLLTTIDRDAYAAVGFTYNDSNAFNAETAATVQVNKNGELYELLYVAENGSLGSQKAATVENAVYGTGYVATYSLTDTQFDAFENGASVTYEPYWITLDGVKVTNWTRTVSHQGEDHDSVKIDEDKSHRTVESVGGIETEALSVCAVYTLDWDATPVAPVAPEQPATVTVTVHDGDTYEVEDNPGKFDVTPKGEEGKLFAGWYTDEAFTEVADLTDVQENMDIFAKYVTDSYLQVKYNNLGLLGRGSLRLVSAVDSRDYAETGFVVNGETIVVSSYTTRYNLQTGKTLFGVGRNDPLMVASYNYKNLRRGDTITLQAYWITPDGTTVYGETRTLTYGRFGLEG